MLDRTSIETQRYNKLLKAEYQLGKQTIAMQELQRKYRDLEERHYMLLLSDNKLAKEIVKLGDYVETVTEY